MDKIKEEIEAIYKIPLDINVPNLKNIFVNKYILGNELYFIDSDKSVYIYLDKCICIVTVRDMNILLLALLALCQS